MNVVREKGDQNISLLRVSVVEADYAAAVEKALRDYKKKANIPGFRPGMVPMGVVKKMFGNGVVAEQSYHAASNGLFKYLQEEKIDYVGDVIPSEKQTELDFENNSEFEFLFEIGDAPEVNVELSKSDEIVYNKIAIDDKMRDDFRKNYLRRFGRLVDVDVVESDEALTVTLDNGELNVDDAYVGLISMSEEERAPFIGKAVGYKTTVNVNDLYKTASQRSAILHIKEAELETLNPEFTLEITGIRKFAEPEINEEFFKTAFPEGEIASVEAFDAFVDEQISAELVNECDYMLTISVRNFMMKRANLQMPTEFLKRWLFTINEGKFTMEEIEKDFVAFLDMFTWNYIQKHYIKEGELSITQEEALVGATAAAQAQFAQYGMPSAPAEMLEGYAKQILENKEQANKIFERLYETKVVSYIKEKIKIVEKTISADDFAKLAEEL